MEDKKNYDLPIFIINLPECSERRQSMLAEFSKYNVPVHFFEGKNGKILTEKEILELVNLDKVQKNYNRPLSKGEIGCSISHLKLYKKMIDENIMHAIILEDDVKINDNFLDVYSDLSKLAPKNYIIKTDTSVRNGLFSLFGCKNLKKTTLKKPVFDVFFARGYYIDIIAAKKVLDQYDKIECVADDWTRLGKKSKLRLCFPYFVEDNEETPSFIGEERFEVSKEQASNKKNSIISRLLKNPGFFTRRLKRLLLPLN